MSTVVVFFASFVLFFCLLSSWSTSFPICPQNFSCPNLLPFKYPFYNAIQKQCGLIKVDCTPNGGNITLAEHSYAIGSKYDYDSSVVISIHNNTFEKLVNTTNCSALMNNFFTSPSPLLFSVSIAAYINLFKCTKINQSNTVQQMDDAYFKKSNYDIYNGCQGHKFYYKNSISNATVPTDLPDGCEVIHLPVKEPWQFHDNQTRNDSNIFSLLSSSFSISFKLTSSCEECYKKGGHCHTYNGHFQCLNARTDEPHIKLILAISGLAFIIMLFVSIFIIWRSFCVGGVTMSSLIIILCLKRTILWRKMENYNVNMELFIKNQEFLAPKRYSYSQIEKMTSSFKVKLGQGGFGSVYKGVLSDHKLVAVKVLSEIKGNGEDFINEVASVGRTSHVNIVSLVGFCLEGRRRALIYEFMPNGSLERFIYDRVPLSSSQQLGWEKLHQIAIGIARGLEYLHRDCNTRILHFDIKPHNILLDNDFCPKISDFGLAKLLHEKESKISMSHLRGTPGYIAPELFSRNFGQVSHKSDVYSYGMMILEMVGGRRNIEVGVDHTSEIYFPQWIYKKVELHENLGLHGIVSDEENRIARKMIIVGLWCIQTNPLSRPTITEVLEMLEEDLDKLEIPPKPYLYSPSRSVRSPSADSLHPFGSSINTL